MITILPCPKLLETTRELGTSSSTYPKNTVFIRVAEKIDTASTEQRNAIIEDKQRSGFGRKPSVFVLPQSYVESYTGRVEELGRLEHLLIHRMGRKSSGLAAVVGSPGIGKSALACHFAELHEADFPDGVFGFRVDGKDPEAIAREFALTAGEEIASDDDRDAVTIMQEIFRPRQALLIFDNADNTAIQKLFPGGDRCSVILTTRDRALPISAGVPKEGQIDLPVLPHSDSRLLLERILGEEGEERVAVEREAADEIIGLVGNLPLALQIIGAALRMHPWFTMVGYAASLAKNAVGWPN